MALRLERNAFCVSRASVLEKVKTFLSRPVGILILATVGVALLGLVEGLRYALNLIILLKLVGFAALLGAFFGTIYATDSRSGLKVVDRPIVRTAISAVLGLIAAWAASLSPTHALFSATALGALGWLGMTWARYVDF